MTALDQLGRPASSWRNSRTRSESSSKAYELQRKVLGPEHEDTIHTLRQDRRPLRRHGEARSSHGDRRESAEDCRRRIWGDEYEFTLVSMNNLGLLYRDLGRPEDALPLFEEAERIATANPRGRLILRHFPTSITEPWPARISADGRRLWATSPSAWPGAKVLGDGHLRHAQDGTRYRDGPAQDRASMQESTGDSRNRSWGGWGRPSPRTTPSAGMSS